MRSATTSLILGFVKAPNWREAAQLAIYKYDRGVELESVKKKSSLVVRGWSEMDLNPWPSDFIKSGALTTRPRFLYFHVARSSLLIVAVDTQ